MTEYQYGLIIANGYWESLRFELPTPFDHGWRRVIDTALATPLDIQQPETQAVLEEEASYAAGPRSVVVLFSGAAKS